MHVACWSVKGGAGTTVLAAALALLAAQHSATGALLVDLAGEAATVLGAPAGDAASAGVHDWLGASDAAPTALARLERQAGSGLALLPAGDVPSAPPPASRAEALRRHLSTEARPVVIDCGVLGAVGSISAVLAGGTPRSLLVLRNCYLAARRAQGAPVRPTGVVVVEEPGRALAAGDLGAVLGVPVLARVAYDPAVARAADAGLLHGRLPRHLSRALQRVLEPVP